MSLGNHYSVGNSDMAVTWSSTPWKLAKGGGRHLTTGAFELQRQLVAHCYIQMGVHKVNLDLDGEEKRSTKRAGLFRRVGQFSMIGA